MKASFSSLFTCCVFGFFTMAAAGQSLPQPPIPPGPSAAPVQAVKEDLSQFKTADALWDHIQVSQRVMWTLRTGQPQATAQLQRIGAALAEFQKQYPKDARC